MQEFEKRTTILKKKQPPPVLENAKELRQERAKKIYKTVEKAGRRQQEERKQKLTEFERFKADEPASKVLKEFNLTISEIFNRFSRVGQPSTFYASDVGLLINYQGFNRFAAKFNIYPGLLTQTQTLQIFRQLTREQTPIPGAPKGLAEHEFSDVFVRIAMEAADKLTSGDLGVSPGTVIRSQGDSRDIQRNAMESEENSRDIEGDSKETEVNVRKSDRSAKEIEKSEQEAGRKTRQSGADPTHSRRMTEEVSRSPSSQLLLNLFEWLGLTPDPKHTSVLLKEVAARRGTFNTREKKRMTQSTAHLLTVSPTKLKLIRKGY